MINDSTPALISCYNLRKYFPIRGGLFATKIGDVRAVDGVTLDVRESETLGLVGESGCGKTTVGRLMLRLIEPTSGHTYYHPSPEILARLESLYATLKQGVGAEGNGGTPEAQAALKELDEIADQYSLYRLKHSKMKELRGKLQIVFQDPFSSLSPRMLVRDIIGEPLTIHHAGSRSERAQRVAELVQEVGLNPEHLWRFPHEFSGGQRQRIGIARALALRPEFIVLDEPTSALDVSVQAQILNILKKLQAEQRLAYMFISHHLSVVRAMSHHVAVMYLGEIVERAGTEDLFSRPLHPYTQALLSAIPVPDPTLKRERIVLKGDVPSPAAPPPGCRFHTRCPAVMPVCSHTAPPLIEVRKEHWVACHLYPPTEGAAAAGPLTSRAAAGEGDLGVAGAPPAP
ncbi:MAG TPA: ABC transporter ATP-binding protein [Thermoplasmata archaeon]|jgi:oligopeptide/dipeptide ABC transporter ATP-binding protein